MVRIVLEQQVSLASALRDVKRLERLPDGSTQAALTQAWSPWRAVAARLLWAHYLDARGSYPPPDARHSSPRKNMGQQILDRESRP